MPGRWRVLALLFAVRATMALQFQSVAALTPLLAREFGVDLADIGLLIGLYLAPGIALALPGGAIGKRVGDKPVVLAGLGMMLCGGLVMALGSSWEAQLTGRLLAGVGGVLLNVIMSKMVTDWFAGKEIATAMAIFVNSWPFGIALALVVLPPIATALGISAAYLCATAAVAGGLVALAALYRAPVLDGAVPIMAAWPTGKALAAIVVAGLIWGLYNASFGMIFSFGPALLTERSWSLSAASSITSIVLWLTVISVPLGGFIADRTGTHGAMLVGGCLAFAVLLFWAARTEAAITAFVALGLVSGLSAGSIMSLPARVLAQETRAAGMGIFFALFYLCVVIAPWVGGTMASAAGTSSITFDLGAAMLLACCACAWLFARIART